MENFIRIYKLNNKICDNLIEYHKTNIEYKKQGTTIKGIINKDIKESLDVFFFNPSTNKTINNFFILLSECINKYSKEFDLNICLHTDVINHIQYYPVNGGFKVFHSENSTMQTLDRKLVYMLYLNDVDDGGTEFKYQKLILKAKKGNLVIWPAEFTHTHRGIVSKTKEKYIATGWFRMRQLP
jgi:hypothetical protein